MNHSGDAAEQIVRLSLEGVEVAARITGTAAKEIATLIVAALKSDSKHLKLKGKARMTSMLKSGKALEIFSIKQSDLQKFMQGAKQYGIVYCVLRNKKQDMDGMCDIMVKADDAPKISRLVERFMFATVDKARIENEIVQSKAERAQGAEPKAPDKNDTEKLLDDLLGTNEGKAAPATPEPLQADASKTDKGATENHPLAFGSLLPKTRPSEPTSESRSKSAGVTSSKSSVKGEIREIKAARRSKEEADAPRRDRKSVADKPKATSSTTHKQPQNGGRPKSKKTKERS